MKNKSMLIKFNGQRLILVLCLSLIIIISSCIKNKDYSPKENIPSESKKREVLTAEEEKSPIKLSLSISNAPALNKEVTVTVTLNSIWRDHPNTVAIIRLPKGFELVSGNTAWNGEVKENITTSFSIIVKAIKIGNWTIEANARSPPTGDTWVGGEDFLYISISENSSEMRGDRPFPKPRECEDVYINGELIKCTN